MSQCLKVRGDENCQLFGFSINDCKICKPTYKALNGKCLKYFTGCMEYSNNKCLSCEYGKRLINNRCEGILHCDRYENERCTSCENNYFLSNQICFHIDRNCAKVDTRSGACEVCRFGYRLVGYRCL